jgi:hypothetical protein
MLFTPIERNNMNVSSFDKVLEETQSPRPASVFPRQLVTLAGIKWASEDELEWLQTDAHEVAGMNETLRQARIASATANLHWVTNALAVAPRSHQIHQ